jgi:hypothetical protein
VCIVFFGIQQPFEFVCAGGEFTMVNKDTVTISKVTKSPGKIIGPFFFINKYFFY